MIIAKCLKEMHVHQISCISPQDFNIIKENPKKVDCPQGINIKKLVKKTLLYRSAVLRKLF
jgi:hypothetical protein